MKHLVYLSVLAGCLLATSPLPRFLRVKVWSRPRRLCLSVLPAALLFTAWDVHAIAVGHWTFDPAQISGAMLGALPLEELLFFIVVPVCAVLAYEAIIAGRNRREPLTTASEASGAADVEADA
ncbi:MAG: lycopene cyclase domain-containing protein [Actinobacteria bacterium]|nr:lycopene cyclase domain-containing protein [Actinomycetota bacterium]